MSDEQNIDAVILDVRGLNCPLPVLKAKKALREIMSDGHIWVETTDPLSAIDIPNFCKTDGHTLVKFENVDDYQRYLIKKSDQA